VLYQARRRYPRLPVRCDAFYEGEERSFFAGRADVSLRGLFLPCLYPDRAGARGVVHLDLGEGAMLRAEVEVVRCDWSAPGQAVRFVNMAEAERSRLAAWLLKRGGLAMLPQLDRSHPALTRNPLAAAG
jgi:hypothetical protein